jgi:hypothetical protein
MSRRACYHLESRFIVSEENLANIREKASPSGKFVWVNSIERLRVCTLVGVPGKYLDLLLPEVTPLPMIAVEIGVKLGSFDGAKRWRITFRSWNKESAEGKTPNFSNPGRGKLSIEEDEPDYTALLARWYSGGIWAASFPRLRYLIDERTDLLGIFMHQAKSWFPFLLRNHGEDVRQAGEVWAALPFIQGCKDLVVLNRTASAALYDLASNMGWRKLTLRDKRRYGLTDNSPSWHRADGLLLSRSYKGQITGVGCNGGSERRGGNSSGVGRFTLDAASGRVAIRGVCPECAGIESECRCG